MAHKLSKAVVFFVLLLVGAISFAQSAPAGTSLPNTAKASFSLNGSSWETPSNTVVVQTAAEESLILKGGGTVAVPTGGTAQLQHTLTNNGNTSEQVALSVSVGSGTASSSIKAARTPNQFTPTSVHIYLDVNNTGVFSTNDPEITLGVPFTLSASQSVGLFVFVAVPAGATAGDTDSITLTATTSLQNYTVKQVDIVVISGASITLTKTASESSAKAGDSVTFTLNAVNTGSGAAGPEAVTVDGAAASYVILRDAIPLNSSFLSVGNAGGAKVLYHLAGDSNATNFLSQQPSDLSQVDEVAFALTTLASGTTFNASFNIQIHSNASGTLKNTGYLDYLDGVARETSSNQVSVQLPQFVPQVSFYNQTYGQVVTVAHAGASLYVQGSASACNVDPSKADVQQIRLTTSLSLDDETFSATETGPNTGIFRIAPYVKTADAATTSVVKGDGILEVLTGDHVTATLICSGQTAQALVYLDPAGVVFDSKTNANVSGATVTLIDVTGAGNGGNAGQPATVYLADGMTSSPSTVTTGSDGRFQFPVVAPSTYQLKVVPPAGYKVPSTVLPASLPTGHNIDASGSYLGSFTVSAVTGTVILDVPADETSVGGLFVEKTVNKQSAEIGDFIDYTVKVTNQSGADLASVNLTDTLPLGFSYTKNTGRLISGTTTTNITPTVTGQVLLFNLGAIKSAATVTVTYRVQVGPGTPSGKSLNKAVASGSRATSNTSSVAVVIGGGVFSDLGYIVGRVSTKTSTGKLVGVPGVKVFMEDGTYAITDAEGNYSLYGVSAVTHVLKADAFSLPRGTNLIATDNRKSGDGATTFVDMKFGELQRADFTVAYSPKLERLIEERSKLTGTGGEIETLTKSTLQATPVAVSALTTQKSDIASGLAQNSAGGGKTVSASQFAQGSGQKLYEGKQAKISENAAVDVEDLIKGVDSNIGFLNLTDKQVLQLGMSDIWIKGPADSEKHLMVNGKEIPSSRIGSHISIKEKGISADGYVAVELNGGDNILEASFRDQFGNVHTAKIDVLVVTSTSRIKVTVPTTSFPADGYTKVPVKIEFLDKNNNPVMMTQHVTLESSVNGWLVKDLDEKTDGIQTIFDGGVSKIFFLAPSEPSDVKLRVTDGEVKGEATISFIPELRPMTAAGVVEYQLNFTHASSSAVQNITGTEGFEDKLSLFANSSNNFQAGARSAVYLKGKILGSVLLTLSYDSNKTSGTQLFRDIQPDQFYPVYGDASVKGFDAQSTSKLYLRLESGRSYLLYGDYQTQSTSSASGAMGAIGDSERQLTAYNRTLNGARENWENSRIKVSTFASLTSQQNVVTEFAANGTSGPYNFQYTNGVEGSETVQLWTRDRNQPSVVLTKTPQVRFQDYEFEPFSGQLLFKSAIPTLDDNGNPIYIHVQYEVDNGGPRAWVGGLDAQMLVTSKWTVGMNAVGDGNQLDPNQLYGFRTSYKLPYNALLGGELAKTTDQTVGSGLGYRIYYKQENKRIKANLYFARTGSEFDNISSSFTEGKGEAGGKFEYTFSPSAKIVADFIRTEDTVEGVATIGGKIDFEKRLKSGFKLSFGLRHSENGASGTVISSSAAETSVTNADQTTLIAKLSKEVRSLHRTTVGIEVEQDVSDGDKHDVTASISTPIPHGKIYARQELLSSLGSQYDLNDAQTTYATKIGIETETLKKLHVFSEYRDIDELTGRTSEAALGLRDTWKLNPNLSFNASFEQVHTLGSGSALSTGTVTSTTSGTTTTTANTLNDANNSVAITGGMEYNLHGTRGSARMEYRTSSTSNSILGSFSVGKKISPRLTLLSRNILMFEKSGSGTSETKQNQVRFQSGAAYRGSESSRWDALMLMEYRLQSGSSSSTTNENLAIFSTHVNYQPKNGTSMNFRYATKWLVDNSNSLSTTSYNQLFSFHVTHDLTRKFDVGLIGSILSNTGLSQRQNNVGAEFGFQLKQNLWLSTGYNFLGFYDRDLPGGSDARQGAFVRLRFKFDENILKAPGRTQLRNGD